jgi:signal transduction histidine kinase
MKGLSRDNRAIFAGFALLFAGLALLVGLFVASQSRKAAILFEYEADRIASGLLDGYRETGDAADGKLDLRVQAFGVYRPSGQAVAVFGSAPATMAPEEASRPFRYDSGARTLTLVRSTGPGAATMGGMMRGGPAGMAPGMTAGRGGTLYLRLDAGAFSRARRLYAAGVVIAPLAVAGIGVAFFFLLVSNVRYRRRAAERETLARLGESARTLAHEIRNPLGAIRMQTALLRRSAAGAHELDVIDEEVERLNTLSRRVGDFLKSPTGAPGRIALGEFVRELARRSPYPLHVHPELPNASVWFDRALLRSVIENLSRNAYESYDDQPGDRSVEVSLSREDGRVVLTVRDRGKGVPGAMAEKVFDPFFTDKIRGSGIGLPLSRRFVEAAGGTLTLRPREGGGTEARVALPELEEQ